MLHLLEVFAIAIGLLCLVIPSWRPFIVIEREDGSFLVLGSKTAAAPMMASMLSERRRR